MGLDEFISTIRGWINYESMITDAVITSWIRMAEERINHELRHKDMIERATATMIDDAADLPPDWLELIYVRYIAVPESNNLYQRSGKPFGFVAEDEYWKRTDQYHPEHRKPCYTIIGNSILVSPGMAPTGTKIEIGYYAEIPPLDNDPAQPNYFFVKHPRLYTFASLAPSAPFLIEDERAITWEAETTRLINMMNEASRAAKTSGSPLKGRIRSFG